VSSSAAETDGSAVGAGAAPARLVGGLVAALTLLTVLPVPKRAPCEATVAPLWFPAVGAGVGALAGGVLQLATPAFGRGPASVLAVTTLVLATGGLHQDGLADCADGAGVHGDRTRRLEAMRDPRIGAFGGLALLIWLMVTVSAVHELGPTDALLVLPCACALARWAALLHGVSTLPARRDGLGAAFHVQAAWFWLASLSAFTLTFAAIGPWAACVAVATASVVALVVSVWARRAIGGRTGDTLGASVAVAEAALCLVLVAVVG
jgi:adenosylcobinamide-GDP ribazoletransferase